MNVLLLEEHSPITLKRGRRAREKEKEKDKGGGERKRERKKKRERVCGGRQGKKEGRDEK